MYQNIEKGASAPSKKITFFNLLRRYIFDKPEVTWRAVFLGIFLGSILAAANVYLAMKVGAFNPGSIPGALAGAGLFHATGSQVLILEANIVQTITSSAANFSGAFFDSIPVASHFGGLPPYFGMVLYLFLGGVVGISLSVIFRRYLVVEEQLPYPSGAAVATTLNVIGDAKAAKRKFTLLITGLVTAGVVTLLQSSQLGGFLPWALMLDDFLPENMSLGFALAPLFFGFGYFMGARVAIGYFVGCAISWLFASPLLVSSGTLDTASWEGVAHFMSSPASGLIIGGTLLPMILGWKSLVRAFTHLKLKSATDSKDTETDLPIILPIIMITLGIVIMSIHFSDMVSLFVLVVVVILATFFALIAARTTGETGFTPTSLFVWIALGFLAVVVDGDAGVLAFCAGIIAVAVGQSADSMNDLKTGHLIGATPASQQFVAYIGLAAGAIVAPFVFLVIVDQYGIFNEEFPVPFGIVAKEIVESVSTGGQAFDWNWLGGGLIAGIGLTALKLPALGVGLGMFAPSTFGLSVAIGGLVRAVLKKKSADTEDDGVAFFSGLLAGSGIMGVIMALIGYFTG